MLKRNILNIILIILFLCVSAFLVYILIVYKSEVNNRTTIKNLRGMENSPIVALSIFDPSLATVGRKYTNTILATISGYNEDIAIKAEGLPDGLVLDSCTQQFDTDILPKPNTIVKCLIEGTPINPILYNTIFTATASNNLVVQSTVQKVQFQVVSP